jgi:polyhydroxybutyrate depolymerase
MIKFALRICVLCCLLGLLAHAALTPRVVQAQAGGCSASADAVSTGVSENTLLSGGLERFYITYVPSGYDASQPVALVLTLHGFGGNATQQEEYSGWDAIAERENFIVVHPQGTQFPLRWHAYGRDVSYMPRQGADDVQFIRELIETLQDSYCIDPARIYVNGLSNGGGMTYRLACELSDQFAAVGIVAGAVAEDESCAPIRPVPVMVFHGSGDPVVDYEGSADLTGVETWVATWAERNSCDSTPIALETQGDVSGISYPNCAENADVILYTIAGGGHTWPGSEPLLPFVLGPTTQDINASEALWQFFVEHPME